MRAARDDQNKRIKVNSFRFHNSLLVLRPDAGKLRSYFLRKTAANGHPTCALRIVSSQLCAPHRLQHYYNGHRTHAGLEEDCQSPVLEGPEHP